MANPERITRKTLARYAALLGRGSVAAKALQAYDAAKADGRSPVGAWIRTNGFDVTYENQSGQPVTHSFG